MGCSARRSAMRAAESCPSLAGCAPPLWARVKKEARGRGLRLKRRGGGGGRGGFSPRRRSSGGGGAGWDGARRQVGAGPCSLSRGGGRVAGSSRGGVRSPPSPGARRPPGGALRESSRFLTVSRRSAGINPAVDPVGAPSARRRPFPHSRGQGSDGASPSPPARVELPVLGPFRLSPAGGRREAFVSSPPAGLGPSPDPGAAGSVPLPPLSGSGGGCGAPSPPHYRVGGRG